MVQQRDALTSTVAHVSHKNPNKKFIKIQKIIKTEPRRADNLRKKMKQIFLQPVADVGADIYRIRNANVAVIFKPFSFVKDSVGGDIINSEVSFPYVQLNFPTDDCSSAAILLVTGSVHTS